MPELSLATFNVHAGIDGWGRRYDLVEACRRLTADVIVLQEIFAPAGGPSQADEIAEPLGLAVVSLPLARAWRRCEPAANPRGWEPRKVLPSTLRALRVGGRVDSPGHADLAGYEEGTWGLAVLTALPVLSSEVLELGRLARDFTDRRALVVELDAGSSARRPGAPSRDPRSDTVLKVIGTHSAHVTAGSPVQIRRLCGMLQGSGRPSALAGDMNLWGPPLRLLMPGWKRAVRARTWPAWRPHSQPDHILVNRRLTVLGGQAVRTGNSDHLAVRARICW
ncbi:MAG: endonuclease/exonuclease/phosphatase family protein [Acidimicrobiales bacterium]